MGLGPRPYLVIPKLIEQPTWGGDYIVTSKGWAARGNLGSIRIGQSYELFSGSNLSLVRSSDDPMFEGELTNSTDVEQPTKLSGAIAVADLVASSPADVLGAAVVQERGDKLELLIKFTQALGNSFQVHIKAGLRHPKWKPKPEAWYYFEPGYITLGVKSAPGWDEYEAAVRAVESGMRSISGRLAAQELTHEEAQRLAQDVLTRHDPWQYVNVVQVGKDELVDLSAGGIHHSWEEDGSKAPLGNVLLELQAEAMDAVSTFRSFDKGKLGRDGSVRPVHIDEYFEAIDRSADANDPARHLRKPEVRRQTEDFEYSHLLDSPYYNLDMVRFTKAGSVYGEQLDRYKHLFVKRGRISVSAHGCEIIVGEGHSCFVPANAGYLTVTSSAENAEVLVSY